MVKWSEGNILTRGINLHFYRGGEGSVPLVMLHGISDDGMCWSPVAAVLAENYGVVLVDIRGHGKSDAPDDGYDYGTMADEISGLIEGLRLEEPVMLGHSMGAMIALIVAARYPTIPRMMILEDPPAFWHRVSPGEDDLAAREGMRAWFEQAKHLSREELLALVRGQNPAWSDAEIEPWVEAKLRFSPKIIQLLDIEKSLPSEVDTLFREILCPTLLITSDPDLGALLGSEEVSSLKALVPHINHVRIAGAGHNIRREQYSRYVEAVTSFLAGG
jgi:N-formylmaleamate deformylase